MNPSHMADLIRLKLLGGRRFPVDPVTISRGLGLDVREMVLPENVSGALIKKAGKSPVIVVHHADPVNRKRFSCAHELGHYVDRSESSKSGDQYEYIDLRSQESSTGQDPAEVFANQFAAALLMPSDEVKEKAKELTNIELALYFGVSMEAMKYRLSKLGLLK